MFWAIIIESGKPNVAFDAGIGASYPYFQI